MGMLILPGEQNSNYLADSETREVLFYEPVLEIGSKVQCEVLKATPVNLELKILKIHGHDSSNIYKATFRPEFISQDIEAVHLHDTYKKSDVLDFKVTLISDSLEVLCANL